MKMIAALCQFKGKASDSLWILLLYCVLCRCLADWQTNYDVPIEPGHVNQEYDAIEQVKAHNNSRTEEVNVEDEEMLKEAILDVGYYLRRFKFSGEEPRSCSRYPQAPPHYLFVQFPEPPLRNIHWEVRKYCEGSFVECVKYIQDRVSRTHLPRHLDSLTVTRQNGWSFITDRPLIESADVMCVKLLEKDNSAYEPAFWGSLDRFRWLLSASYYMCLYAMKEVEFLNYFSEDCDNFGACIDWNFGLKNEDVRANNGEPFACATYSFCPDPCCPLKHISDFLQCSENSSCSPEFFSDTTCTFSRKQNSDLESLMFNRWNISCVCDESGMKWDSKSGMCVDIDECSEEEPVCRYPEQTCRNLPGTYECLCSPLGYEKAFNTDECESLSFLDNIFNSTERISQSEKSNFIKFVPHLLASIYNKLKSFLFETVYRHTITKNHTS